MKSAKEDLKKALEIIENKNLLITKKDKEIEEQKRLIKEYVEICKKCWRKA